MDIYLENLVKSGAPFFSSNDLLLLANRQEITPILEKKTILFKSYFTDNNIEDFLEPLRHNGDLLELLNDFDLDKTDQVERLLNSTDLSSLEEIDQFNIALKITKTLSNNVALSGLRNGLTDKQRQAINLLLYIAHFSNNQLYNYALGDFSQQTELDNFEFKMKAFLFAELLKNNHAKETSTPFFIEILNQKPYNYKIKLIEYAVKNGVDIDFAGYVNNPLELCKVDFSRHEPEMISKNYLLDLFLSIGLSFEHRLFATFARNNQCSEIAIEKAIEMDKNFIIPISEVFNAFNKEGINYYLILIKNTIKSKKKIQFNIDFSFIDEFKYCSYLRDYFYLVKSKNFEYLKITYHGKQIFFQSLGWCQYQGKYNENKIPHDEDCNIIFLNGMCYKGPIQEGVLTGDATLIFREGIKLSVKMDNNVIIETSLHPDSTFKLNFFPQDLFFFSGFDYLTFKRELDKIPKTKIVKTSQKTTQLTALNQTHKLQTIFFSEITEKFQEEVTNNHQLNNILVKIENLKNTKEILSQQIKKINKEKKSDSQDATKPKIDILFSRIKNLQKHQKELEDLANNIKEQIFNAIKINIAKDDSRDQATDAISSSQISLSEIIF
jgi:hypothetical protein